MNRPKQNTSRQEAAVIPRATSMRARQRARETRRPRLTGNAIIAMAGIMLLSVIIACSSTTNRAGLPSERQGNLLGFFSSLREPRANAEPHYRLAQFYQNKGKHREAIIEFGKAILIAPDYVDALNGMGVSYDLLGQYEAAVHAYTSALAYRQDIGSVWNNLGYSYLLQDKPDEAIEAFSKAVALEQHVARYRKNLGLAYAKKGQVDQAVSTFSTAVGPAEAKDMVNRVLADIRQDNTMKGHLHLAEHIGTPRRTAHDDLESMTKSKNAGESVIETIAGYAVAGHVPVPPYTLKQQNALMSLPSYMATTGTSDRDPAAKVDPLFRRRGEIEVANGNGASRMARKVGSYLTIRGLTVTWLTNAENFRHGQTMIYYREGNRDLASYVERQLPGDQESVMAPILNRPENVKVKVVIGKDLLAYNEQISGVKR